MAYNFDASVRALSTVTIIGLILACNPEKGESESSTGEPASSSSGEQPTTGSTSGDASSSTSGDPTGDSTGSTTSTTSTTDASSSSTTDDTTTGELACGEDIAFTASWDAWKAAVADKGETYFYTLTSSGGGFIDPDFCIHRTLVAVADGLVVERRFELIEVVGEPECDEPFIETGAEVGSHPVALAAKAVTVEALYGGCCDAVIHIQPAEEFTVTFETDDAGLMKTCFYVTNGCADNCDGGPVGPSLQFETLAFGAPPPAP